MSCSFRLSRGVLSTIQPPIPRAKAWGAAYPAIPACPLLDMSQGAPGNPPPEILLNALASASSSPQSSEYGYVLGELALRSAFAQEMKTVYGQDADITAQDVAITAGCNMAFIAAVMCLADAGDEVILPVPCYFNHSMSLNLLGIKCVPLYTRPDEYFFPSVAECKKLITPKTKAIALVTPNNPTGAIYPPLLISQFQDLARENNIALLIDETYRDFVEPCPPHRLFSQSSTWRSTLVHLFSFSKSYAIPGHRLGAIVASPELLSCIETTLDCIQICPPRPPQLALASPSLLSELRTSILDHARALRARHALFRASLPKGWSIGAQGGYYAYVEHPVFRSAPQGSVAFCERLAKDLGVLVLPGQFFCNKEPSTEDGDGPGKNSEAGSDRWMRFSVANVNDEQIVGVCERLKDCESLFG